MVIRATKRMKPVWGKRMMGEKDGDILIMPSGRLSLKGWCLNRDQDYMKE